MSSKEQTTMLYRAIAHCKSPHTVRMTPAEIVTEFTEKEVAQAVREREVEIADELEEGHSCESNECWTCDYLSQLRSDK